jgi:alkylation response protein AidB-like acyl-CoA dehydrogenase
VVEPLAETGLLRLAVPRSLGGLETDLVTTARLAEEVSRNDSAVGWTLFQSTAADLWCARLPDAGAEEIYADGPNTFIAAAFRPLLQARQARGGYRLSGAARMASAIHIANWVLVLALVMDGDQARIIDGAPCAIGAFLRARECRILDTWYSLDMRATDTNDIAADDVFVPTERTFPVVPEFEPGTHYRGPLYRASFTAGAATFAPIGLGIAGDAVAELRGLAERKTPTGTTSALRELASTQAKVGLADAILRSARTFLYDILDEAWRRMVAAEPSSLAQRTDLLLAAAHAMQSAVHVVELMHGAAGTTGIMTGSRLERHFRDAATLRQHTLFSQNRYETVGKVALGLALDLQGFENFLRF